MAEHSGVWTIEDRCASAWHYLPFDVPPGAAALRVDLDYDASGAVLDLGCLGPAGFRGWSGGARRSFVITAWSATPGYLPGELEPGTWDEPVPPAADRPAPRALPGADGMRWLAGDLHAHTVHSDGVMTVPELARFAAGRGLDFLAVTDHNTVSHHRELPGAAARHGIVLLPGQELTTDRGHANALGELPWVDFREPPDAWLEATRPGGGLLSVNHPYGGQVSWTAPMRQRPPLIEVWHWSWLDLRWTAPL